MLANAIEVKNLTKYYSKERALNNVNLNIKHGEIFALLGVNGAGKSTLINIICGLVNKTSGTVNIFGLDNIERYKEARALVGLVPQELHVGAFEKVLDKVVYSRALFNKAKDDAYIESLLKKLSLWDKRFHKISSLSGGMKRRLLIAKAMSHEPKILFLDEPSAGVDAHLRQNVWEEIKSLKNQGVPVIVTTHHTNEIEGIADRVGIIDKGEITVVEEQHV